MLDRELTNHEKLLIAVKEERYEDAAALRDLIAFEELERRNSWDIIDRQVTKILLGKCQVKQKGTPDDPGPTER